MNAYELAHMAGVTSPDSLESPGAQWLVQVASYADELGDELAADNEHLSDDITEAADSVVPVYTHNRWQVFVDLCAYTEDIEEYSAQDSDMTMTTQAGIALYLIAERLLTALVEAKSEQAADEDGE
jgi:hypothetical protein